MPGIFSSSRGQNTVSTQKLSQSAMAAPPPRALVRSSSPSLIKSAVLRHSVHLCRRSCAANSTPRQRPLASTSRTRSAHRRPIWFALGRLVGRAATGGDDHQVTLCHAAYQTFDRQLARTSPLAVSTLPHSNHTLSLDTLRQNTGIRGQSTLFCVEKIRPAP
jgi:hypothetical protein